MLLLSYRFETLLVTADVVVVLVVIAAASFLFDIYVLYRLHSISASLYYPVYVPAKQEPNKSNSHRLFVALPSMTRLQ